MNVQDDMKQEKYRTGPLPNPLLQQENKIVNIFFMGRILLCGLYKWQLSLQMVKLQSEYSQTGCLPLLYVFSKLLPCVSSV